MKKPLVIVLSLVALLVTFVVGFLLGSLRVAKIYRIGNYRHAMWQYGVVTNENWELLTNSIILEVKNRGALLRAAMEDSSLNYLVAMPSRSGSMTDQELLARIIAMQEELKGYTWRGSVFPGEEVEPDAAPEPPPAAAVRKASQTMNTNTESEAPAGGGRR